MTELPSRRSPFPAFQPALRVNRYRVWQVAVDATLIVLAWYLAFQARFDKGIPGLYDEYLGFRIFAVVVVLKLAVFVIFGLYEHWWRYTSIRDIWRSILAVTLASIVSTLAILLWDPVPHWRLPRGIVAIDWLLLLALVTGVRLATRTVVERPWRRAGVVERGKEALIVGAGDAGQVVIREMQKNPGLGYTPIGLVDDDPRKKNMRLLGVRVLGTTADLGRLLAERRPDEVMIAIPSAAGETRQRIIDVCREAGVPVKTLPGVHERSTLLSFQPPAVGEEEIEAVAKTIRSGWLTSGPRAEELEQRFADYVGAPHAVAVASGTAAMHLSLVALGVGPGDEVITTPITWPATANVIVHAGATPVFADVRPDNLNIDPAAVAAAVTPRTKAILPVDLAGQPCDLDPLLGLGPPVVEDAAHAAEAVYRGRKIGTIARATCFSLYATKNVAAGEGGVVTTADDDLAAALRELRLMRRGDGSRYDIRKPGYKANLSDILAAIALSQLDKLERHAEIRRRYVELYDEAVAELPGVEPLARDPRDRHAVHLYIVRIDPALAGADRDAYQRALREENIATSIHFLPVHRLTYYRERFPDHPPLPVAERAGAQVLSLPLSPAHSVTDIEDAIEALRSLHARFTSA